jgi:hypothetical protein
METVWIPRQILDYSRWIFIVILVVHCVFE